VPGNQENDNEMMSDPVAQAKQEAAEIVARARMKAEAIMAEARTSQPAASSPLSALGDNAEEIIGQVRKLIKKQQVVEGERQALASEVESLKAERDELVQRLTDAVVRMEELSEIATNTHANADPLSAPSPAASPPPTPPREAASLTARLEQAEREEPEDTSLAARLERADREERQSTDQPDNEPPAPAVPASSNGHKDTPTAYVVKDSDESFYSRHSAKLPRLEGDGGRSVLSAVGGMRPELEPKGRKGRRARKKA
jgi:hypothetical protein